MEEPPKKKLQTSLIKDIQQNYYNKDVPFFSDPVTVIEVISGENGEFRQNYEKQQQIQEVFQKINVELVCKIRGDGNCFFRSVINGYILLKIGLVKTSHNSNQQLKEFFNELMQIPLLTPSCQKESLGNTYPSDEIEYFVKENLRKLFDKVIDASNTIETVANQLNSPEVDFSLQILSKSLLLDAALKAIDQEVSPLCYTLLIDELKESISKLNTENGDDSLFSLVSSFFNCKLSIIRCQKTGMFDLVQFEPYPGFKDSCLKFEIFEGQLMEIALWFKTGHYYLLILNQQCKILF